MVAAADGMAAAALINPALGGGFGIRLDYDRAALPCLIEWQCLQSGLYVLGIEPSTNHVLGRKFAEERGELMFLDHGEARQLPHAPLRAGRRRGDCRRAPRHRGAAPAACGFCRADRGVSDPERGPGRVSLSPEPMPISSTLPRTPATVERAMLLDVVGDPAYRAGGVWLAGDEPHLPPRLAVLAEQFDRARRKRGCPAGRSQAPLCIAHPVAR